MSKSSLTQHDLGSLTLRERTSVTDLVQVINVTGSSLTLTNEQSNSLIVCNYTAGTLAITLPLLEGANFKFIRDQSTYVAILTPNESNNLFAYIVEGTTGSRTTTNATDIEFVNTNPTVGDRIDIVCDGSKFYANGFSAHNNSILINDYY